MPYPKRLSAKRKLTVFPGVKPDLDNLVKFVFDCGNGIIWSDDKIILKLTAEKDYDDEPCTIIEVNRIDTAAREKMAKNRMLC